MANVCLPCDYEEWWDYQRIFILLSHLRSVEDLKLLISSHTRPEDGPTPISRCLEALKGLLVFLTEFCTSEEQKKFLMVTLPFIARSAALLEERVPQMGIPSLQKQENSALVLGRKVVLSILSNAFLCTFTPLPAESSTFSFDKFFATFLDASVDKKSRQADKLRCILCYFQRASGERCDLSAVITYRRQVLSRELPSVLEWQGNSLPLCPLEVDQDNCVEDSGGHTLQVCFASRHLGGGVLEEGCSEEEIRFVTSPELLVVQLLMEDLEANEAVIVTGTERFSKYSGSGASFKFDGEYVDESERDVFGNLLNSLITLDSFPTTPAATQPRQAGKEDVLWQLNKCYVGFHCQQDRGDISTELLALTVKRGSLAFVAEDYPECGAPFHVNSCQSDLGNVQLNPTMSGSNSAASEPTKMPPPPLPPIVPPQVTLEGAANPLSPIPEVAESPNFPNFMAVDIIESSLQHMHGEDYKKRRDTGSPQEEIASQIVSSLMKDVSEMCGMEAELEGGLIESSGPHVSQSMDDLASALSHSIMQGGLAVTPKYPVCLVETAEEGGLDTRSNLLAKAIISDVLSSDLPTPTAVVTPQTQGECSNNYWPYMDQTQGECSKDYWPPEEQTQGECSSSYRPPREGVWLSSMATDLSDAIVSDAKKSLAVRLSPDCHMEKCAIHHRPSPAHPTIYVEGAERRGSIESGRSSRSSSLTGQNITLHEFASDLTEETLREGVAIVQYTAQGMQGQQDQEEEAAALVAPELDHLAHNLVADSIQDSLLTRDFEEESWISEDSLPTTTTTSKKQPPSLVRQGLSLGSSSGMASLGALPPPGDSDAEGSVGAGYSGGAGGGGSSFNSRLLTPVSSRTGYAWSIASTRDEDSRPVSPTDLNKIGLSLSNDTDEFSSLLSNMVINTAISNVVGESLSPQAIAAEKDGSLPSSSKIGLYLSKLGEAEPPSDGTVQAPPAPGQQASSAWQSMRKQLLRPVATGRCGTTGGEDLQMMAVIQWIAASASGRPRLFYYSLQEESVKELAQVASLLRSKFCTVGQLCQALMAYSKEGSDEKKNDLFSFLLQHYS